MSRQELPCGPCQRMGGYRVSTGGELWPPQAAVPPFDGLSMVGDEDKGDRRIAWTHEPMCAVHAHAYMEAEYAQQSAERQARADAERAKMRQRPQRGGYAKPIGEILPDVLPTPGA